MDVDLTQQLLKKKTEPQPYSLSMGIVSKKKKGSSNLAREAEFPPSQGEVRRWARSGQFAKMAVKTVAVSSGSDGRSRSIFA